jgi:hypothetical protein
MAPIALGRLAPTLSFLTVNLCLRAKALSVLPPLLGVEAMGRCLRAQLVRTRALSVVAAVRFSWGWVRIPGWHTV